MKPYLHARIHAKKYGGIPEDYQDIDTFIDSSKQTLADVRHRALLHNAFGCFIVEKIFGITRVNSSGKTYSPRDVAEDHCLQDLNKIFSVESYLRNINMSDALPSKEISIIEHAEKDSLLYNFDFDKILKIHSFMESSYNVFPDIRHHGLLHHSFGIYIAEKVFGEVIMDNDNKIQTKLIVANHLEREFGYIPIVSDHFNKMDTCDWMSGTEKRVKSKSKFIKLED